MKKRIFAAILTVSLAVLMLYAIGLSLLLRMDGGILFPALALTAVIVATVLVSAWFISKSIVKPLEDPSAETYRELAPLMTRLRSQQAELVRKDDEFRTATDCMNEGLVLLGESGGVISINRAASGLLDVNNMPPEIEGLVEKARRGLRAERIIERNNLSYQFNVSPIVSEEKTVGFALLIFDVTERERSEQMRREFTANVSHELKTPLHSISGCAELLVQGMVKTEDVGQFARQIFSESARMIRLVDDIIKLSRMDEGAEDTGRSEVDLYTLAEAVVKELEPEAEKASVKLILSGQSATLFGIPQMLWMTVYNLCDNAIKYNRPGGFVGVSVERVENQLILAVRDTGIGIPPEHQARVFERFYRVDKSHSKEVGGTGLGLSIVKHAARLHDATVELDSVPVRGTTVTIRFPQNDQSTQTKE